MTLGEIFKNVNKPRIFWNRTWKENWLFCGYTEEGIQELLRRQMIVEDDTRYYGERHEHYYYFTPKGIKARDWFVYGPIEYLKVQLGYYKLCVWITCRKRDYETWKYKRFGVKPDWWDYQNVETFY